MLPERGPGDLQTHFPQMLPITWRLRGAQDLDPGFWKEPLLESYGRKLGRFVRYTAFRFLGECQAAGCSVEEGAGNGPTQGPSSGRGSRAAPRILAENSSLCGEADQAIWDTRVLKQL